MAIESDELEVVDIDNHNLLDNPILTFSGHSDSVYALDSTKNGDIYVSGGGDEIGYLWSRHNSANIIPIPLTGHTDSIIAVCFNHQNSLCVTASMDGTARVYDVPSGNFRKLLDGPSSEITFMRLHSTRNIILIGSNDATVWAFDLDRLDFLNTFTRHLYPIVGGGFINSYNQFKTQGDKVVTASHDGTIFIWDLKTGEVEKKAETDKKICCLSLAEKAFVVGTEDGTTEVFSVNESRPFFVFEGHTDSVESVGFCMGEKIVFASGLDGVLYLWDISTAIMRFQLDLKRGIIQSRLFNHSPLIACGLDSGVCVIVDLRSGEIVKQIEAHSDRILALDISKDDLFIGTAGEDNSCKLFRV